VATARFDVDFGSVERFQGDATQVEAALNRSPEEESISIVCASEAEARRLRETFRASVPLREGRLRFLVGSLSNGFEWKEANAALIGAEQLFGRSIARRSTGGARKKALSKTIDSFMELTPGDLVIHTERGIARYLGVETIDKANQREDHLKLEFADSAYLYVPASRVGKIHRYVGPGGSRTAPALAKLRGSNWEKQKKAAQEGVWELASEMLNLQAARDSLEGVAFPADGPWQRDFESLFPYRETDDQLAAIEAVKRDMERPRPMDRLLCGDVGFGKTEVALRAAFKAVEAGYQVAVLVPTTVLAEQHYRVFSERTAAFPVTVARLSRFVSKKEQKETLEKLKSGAVDVVIGTHRVAQKDVEFRKLGLVIIDEEQKFGVKDKEKLKELRNLVDVLTMTATPIPRTLHLSLVGIRDVSNLETPPADRLPVETRVSRFNPETVRKAILRELNRGGQTFYLHNRVSDIEEVADRLRKIVPEARIRVGHARMASGELEEIMRDFVMRRFDVLVCTTIIESGVDVPNANTIFVDQAHKFGLAELHQIRGRVGREKKQAYCYLTLDANQTLTRDATRRLQAIEEYDRLGSGFHIAMKDLEIRGAGNILGTKQSGHVALVGYEMYCEFLEAAVRAMKNEPQKMKVEVEVDLPGTAILPNDYVADSRTKIDFYRRFDRVATIPEAVDVRNELRDRFGPLPPEAERLFVLAQIRIKAFDYRVRKVQLAQYEGLKDGEKTKMLAITFRAPDLMYKLANDLKRLGATLRLVDDEKDAMRGYVALPRDLFDRNGNPCVDELLEFALKTFDAKNDADDEAMKTVEATRRELASSAVDRKSEPPKLTKNPLGAALRRLREEGKKDDKKSC
ncbi:MAG: transcription-repair coupling factor, partial [Thermoguttaceae bacterium]|nr:transcription-repair coupling factor [Thermoguttaceae bacterium]